VEDAAVRSGTGFKYSRSLESESQSQDAAIQESGSAKQTNCSSNHAAPFWLRTTWLRFKSLLGKQVNGGSLALFRIGLGLVMALEAYSLVRPNPNAISTGDTPLAHYYTAPDIKFHLPYAPFEWMPILPEKGLLAVVALQALAGIAVALGLFYRVSAMTMFLCWGYFFAAESTRTYWQSHYYLELLVCFLMIWMPAARSYSISNRVARQRTPRTVPFWCIFLMRGQLCGNDSEC
jgi:uncharacterized membrane protein YphA (DoxX/SURF4 family)